MIVEALARHVSSPVDLVLFGGGAMVLAYRSQRSTEDLDILIDESQLRIYADHGFGDVIEATNRELEPRGFYIRHLWSPAQEVLVQGWQERLTPIEAWWGNPLLQFRAISPIDMIASKLPRFDEIDREDIRFLITAGWVSKENLKALASQLIITVAWEIEAATIRMRADQLAQNGVC